MKEYSGWKEINSTIEVIGDCKRPSVVSFFNYETTNYKRGTNLSTSSNTLMQESV